MDFSQNIKCDFHCFVDHLKYHNLPHQYIMQFVIQKSSQFLFYSHVQVLLSAVRKPIEFFSALARLKEWRTIQEHVFLDNRKPCLNCPLCI